MFTYLFPIFAFGLVISSVVFLGLQQAADLARNLDVQRSQDEDQLRQQNITPSSAVTPSNDPPTDPSRILPTSARLE